LGTAVKEKNKQFLSKYGSKLVHSTGKFIRITIMVMMVGLIINYY